MVWIHKGLIFSKKCLKFAFMKNILLLVSLLFILSCESNKAFVPTLHEGVFVKGNVNLPDNTVVFLQQRLTDNSFKTIQTTKVQKQEFSFFEKIDEAKLYYIGFRYTADRIPFIANKYDTYILMESNNVEEAKIEGASILHDYYSYKNNLKKSNNKFIYKLDYIKSHSNTILSAIILKEMLGKTKWRIGQNKKGYHFLTTEIQNTNIGKKINAFILENEPLVASDQVIAEVNVAEVIKEENNLSIPIEEEIITETIEVYRDIPILSIDSSLERKPNFYAESIHGNDISLEEISKNNNIILVDFWASWCGPCRFQNPHLKKLYQKYHDKGFTIIGVSEDRYRDMDKWKKAVEKDGLPWHQVIDDNKRVAKMFGVSAVPHTFLLDKKRGVILDKVTSFVVEEKLKEIYGY